MRRKMKRFMASALAFTMAFTMAGTSALAAGVEGKIPPQSVEETLSQEETVALEEEAVTTEETVAEEESVATEETETSEEETEISAQENLTEEEAEPEEAGRIEEETAQEDESKLLEFNLDRFVQDGITSIALHETFENGMPAGWTEKADSNVTAWTVGCGDRETDIGAHSGQKNAIFHIPYSGYGSYLIMPAADYSHMKEVFVGFNYVNRAWGDDVDTFGVYYRVNDGAWKQLFYTAEEHSEWSSSIVSLPEDALTSNVQIAFDGYSNYGNGVGLDDVKIFVTSPYTELNESFNGSIPAAWTVEEDTSTGYKWISQSGLPYNASIPAHSGSANASIGHVYGTVRGASSKLISPWLNLSEMNYPTLDFWYLNPQDSGDVDELGVYYRTRNGEWQQLFYTTQEHENWTNVTIGLPEVVKSIPVQIAFKATDHYGKGIGVDDVQIYGSNDFLRESFDYGIPGSWTNVPGGDYSDYVWRTGVGDGSGNSTHSGDQNALITHVQKGAAADLITPAMDFSGAQNVVVDFWYMNRSYAGDVDELVVGYLHEGTEYAQVIFTAIKAHKDWTRQVLVLPQEALREGMQIKFKALDNYGYGIALDDVRIYEVDSNASYVVTYDANGGTGTTIDHNSYQGVTAATVLESSFVAPAGKTFYGWTTEPDGTGNYYGPGDQIIMVENVTLYALWRSISDEFSVNFASTPYGWSRTSTSGAFRWRDDVYGQTTYSTMGEGEAWLISPVVDLSEHKNAALSFTYANRNNEESVKDLFAYYRIAGGAWKEIPFMPGNTAGEFVSVSFLMPQGALTENVQIGFLSVSCEDHITTINRASLDGVNADFYVIETNVSGLGCIIPSQYYGEEGDYIDVTVIPAEGYVLKSITAVSGGEEIYLADEDGMYQLEMPAGNVTIYAVFSKRIAIFYEDFEHGGALPDGWTFLDRDGDGFNWEISSPDYPERIHSGDYLLASASYDNGKFEPLFPDNWAITPGIQIPYHAVLSFWTRGMDPTWASEKLGVYVGTEPTLDSMQPLIASIITTDEYENYTFDLDDYAGQTVYIAFRHYDVSDEFKVCLEDVGVFAYEEDVLDPVQMRYAKAALDGKLGLAFFVTLPDWLIQDQNAYVTFEQYGEVKTKMLSEVVAAGPGSDGSYRVCTYMPAAYYRENVTMRFYDGIGRRANIVGASSGSYLTDTGVVYTLERCVRSMKNSGDAKTKKLGIAMDDYCTATQIYFGHPTEGVTLTLSSAINGVTESDLSGYKSVRKGTYPSKVKGVTLGASFESANTLKLGLTFEGNKKPTGVSYYVSEDGTLEHAKKLNVRGNQTSGYYIEMKNIPAASLGKTYTFFIKDKTNTFSIGCSVFTYVRATAFNTQMPKLLRNMTKALYLYGKAAEEYFAN